MKKLALEVANEFGCSCCVGGRHLEVTDRLDVTSDGSNATSDFNSWLDSVSVANVGALPYRLDDDAGGTFRGKVIADQDRIIEQIDSGRMIPTGGNTISFGFLDKNHTIGVYNNPQFGFRQPEGYSPFSEAQKDATRASMALWDDLIPQDIIEKNGANGADILFSNTTTGPAQASAYYPGNGLKYQGDVWVATPEKNWSNNWLGFNGYGATTIIHEAGHALGLSHPGAYNFGPGFAVTYANGAEYAQDSEQYSIMSYWSPSQTGAVAIDFRTFQSGNGQTPMIHDILTIQAKYGVDTTTRAGDTVYGYNSTADRDVYDMNLNPFPLLAIYDAGGIDTIDMSGTGAGVFIDLRAGSFSSAAQGMPTVAEINAARNELFALAGLASPTPFTQARADANEAFYKSRISGLIEDNTSVAGVEAMGHMNISIAYNTVIENAIGSSERDLLVGNDVANILTGNAGDDVLSGLGGDDVLNGGDGDDMVSYMGASEAVNVSLANAGPHVTVEGSDTFTSIEGLAGSDFGDVLNGNDMANVLDGNRGDDLLTGAGGADLFQFGANSGNDTITDFVSGLDSIDLRLIDADIQDTATGNQAFVFIDGGAFSGTAGELRSYSDDGVNYLAGDVNGDGLADFTINLGSATVLSTDILL